MALSVTLRTYVCQETACPDLEDGLQVFRGEVADADLLGDIENDFTIQFDLRGYALFVEEKMEETRDRLIFELPTADRQRAAELALDTIIDEYSFKASQWLGSPTAMIQPNERQIIWRLIDGFRDEFVQAVEEIIAGASAQFERELEDEAADSLKRFVVAFVTDQDHNPVLVEGVEEAYINTATGNKNLAREGIIVHPNRLDAGGEQGDSSHRTVIAEICTPDECPEPEDTEQEMEFSCTLNVTGFRDRLPTLSIIWKLPACCPVAVGQYRVEEPPSGILTSEQITFIGGNVSYQWVLWPGRGSFITRYVQQTAVCPMPGRTTLLVEGRAKDGTVHAGGLAGIFSKQMTVATIKSITGEGDQRVITLNERSGTYKPSDWFDYQVGEEVLVFSVGQQFDLPMNESSKMEGSKLRILPAKFSSYGVT